MSKARNQPLRVTFLVNLPNMSVSLAYAFEYIRKLKDAGTELYRFVTDHHADALVNIVLSTYRVLAGVFDHVHHRSMSHAEFTELMDTNLNVVIGSVHWILKTNHLPDENFMTVYRSLPRETIASWIQLGPIDLDAHEYSWNVVCKNIVTS